MARFTIDNRFDHTLDRQIHALRSEAARAGDIMQVAVCDLALDPDVARLVKVGTLEYALSDDDRATLIGMTQHQARESCHDVISGATG